MKVKTYFSTIAFKFFSTYRIFKKLVYIRIRCHQKFEKIHRPEAEILAHKKVTDN